jgi:hypothetical protein
MDPVVSLPRSVQELPRYVPRGDRILVDFCDQFTAEFVILDTLKGRVGFVSPDVAEQIKRTHAPLFKEQGHQDVWVRHVYQHCHCHDDDTPNRSGRKWTTTPSKLGRQTPMDEHNRNKENYALKKERQEAAQETNP